MSPRSKSLWRLFSLAPISALAVFALAAAGGNDLKIGNDAELGEITVDSAGNTLYLFIPDAQGESTCYETCADNWPPVLANDEAVAGAGLDQDLVGSVTRTDGSEQVTYGGWPLYSFVGDTEAGQTNGQGVNDVWYVVAADGTAVGAPEADAAEAEQAEDADSDTAEEEAPAEEADGAVSGDDAELFAALMDEGASVFARICSACHGANGDQALAEHVAILADNSKLENERRVLRRVIHGGGYMPQFGNVLSDREVAAVATFVRNSWGNDYGLIREEAAAEAR